MHYVWLPYLRIQYPHNGPHELSIGHGRFLPDSHDTWTKTLGRERPKFLEIFHTFRSKLDQTDGEPIYGTLLVSDNDEWLGQYVDELVAILFFIGVANQFSSPPDCFRYYPFSSPKGEGTDGDLVTFNTKHGSLMEDAESITVSPPLPVRGRGEYLANLSKREHESLIKVFDENPEHRLVAAVRHFFRAQFSDVFFSPFNQDLATFCACIEAALDINSEQAAGEQFVRRLMEFYDHHEWMRNFFLGWYAERSVHVHGIASVHAGDATDSRMDRITALEQFRNTRWRWTVAQAICRDVILRCLREADPPPKSEKYKYLLAGMHDSAMPLLTKALQSDAIWARLKQAFTVKEAANFIHELDEEEFDTLESIVREFLKDFSWNCMQTPPKPNAVIKVLVTCVLVILKATPIDEAVRAQAENLGKACDTAKADAIKQWSLKHYSWKNQFPYERRPSQLGQQVAHRASQFFLHEKMRDN